MQRTWASAAPAETGTALFKHCAAHTDIVPGAMEEDGCAWQELLHDPSCSGASAVLCMLIRLVSCTSHFQTLFHSYENEQCKLKYQAKKVVQVHMHEFGPQNTIFEWCCLTDGGVLIASSPLIQNT